MIPDEVIERVRDAADIVQLIGEHVELKKTGADYRGSCPFHQGKHRNFSVSPRRNIYYCFVCHEGGDVFSFFQKRLGMDWPSAVRMIAERVGIDVPDDSRRADGVDPREPLWELNATAGEFFSTTLWDTDAGADARGYLRSRSIDEQTARRFGLGFAPRDATALRGHMNDLGFDDDRLLEAGLLVRRDDSNDLRPRFRNRLIFPIHDATGHAVGFGGRLLGPGEPKYLNSADSPVFTKGKLLYGLNWARGNIRREEKALVVEGYFDAVRLTSAGFEFVVAPLGTALTTEQAELLKRYTRNVFLLYDSDKAGRTATFRAGDVLLAQGMSVQVLTLPEGEDPDSFVLKEGEAGVRKLFDAAEDVVESKIRLLERAGWFSDLSRRRGALDRLLTTIRATTDPITRDLYIARASELTGVRKDVILHEADHGSGRFSRAGRAPASERHEAVAPVDRTADRRGRARTDVPVRGAAAEREILAAVLRVPARIDWLVERLDVSDFLVPEHQLIYSAIVNAGTELNVQEVAAELPDDVVPILQGLLDYGETIMEVQKSLDDSLRRIETRKLESEFHKLGRMASVATEDEKSALLREQTRIKGRLVELGGGSWQHYGR